MIRVLLLLITVSIFSFAGVIKFKDIDPKKTIIQIGTYSKQKTVKRIQKSLGIKRDIYIRKGKKYTVIYVVNIPKKLRKKSLYQIRKKYKDAFIQKKAYKAIKKNYNKSRKKIVKVPKLKPKVVSKPKKIESSKVVLKYKKLKSSKIDSNKIAIQIGTYSKQKTVDKIKKELDGKRDIFIKKGKKYTIIYVVNIPKSERKKALKSLRKKYKGAFVSKKFYKKNKMKVEEKQLTELETIELLERLYKEGLENFNQKEYSKSYKLFKQIFKVDMKNMDVDFYLARSAYEIGKYNEALDIYEYMLFRDPHNQQIKIEVGKTYNKLQKYDKAKSYFEESYK